MTGASSSNGSCTLPAAQRSAHPQHTQSPDPGPFSPGFVLATEGSTAHVRPCSSTASTQQPHSRRIHCAHTDRNPPEKTLPRTRRVRSRPAHAQRVPGGRQRALQPRVLARGARVVLGAREWPHLAARQPGVVALPIEHAQQLARPARRRQVLCPRRLHLRAAPLRISSCTNDAVITGQPRAPRASSRRLTTGAKKNRPGRAWPDSAAATVPACYPASHETQVSVQAQLQRLQPARMRACAGHHGKPGRRAQTTSCS